QQLQVYQVACTFASINRQRVELLRDLVLSSQDRHGPRRLEPNLREEVHKVRGELVLRLVRVTKLIVSQLELHRAPRPPLVIELHLERLHYVGGGYGRRLRSGPLDQPAGEPFPADSKELLEVALEQVERPHPGGIHVLGETRVPAVPQRHGAAT